MNFSPSFGALDETNEIRNAMSGLHVDAWGEGPNVILLHGVSLPPGDLAPLRDRLASRFRVHVVHLPGYGKTPEWTGKYDLAAIELRIAEYLHRRAAGPLAVVGISGGAYRALSLALRRDLDVKCTICLGAFARMDEAMAAAFCTIADMAERGEDLQQVGLTMRFCPSYYAAHQEACDRIVREHEASMSRKTLAAELRALADAPNLLPRLAQLRGTLHLLAGDHDAATPVALSEAIVAARPDAQLVVLQDAGHLVLVEQPEASLRFVESALASSYV